jgi:hypothetical protein
MLLPSTGTYILGNALKNIKLNCILFIFRMNVFDDFVFLGSLFYLPWFAVSGGETSASSHRRRWSGIRLMVVVTVRVHVMSSRFSGTGHKAGWKAGLLTF